MHFGKEVDFGIRLVEVSASEAKGTLTFSLDNVPKVMNPSILIVQHRRLFRRCSLLGNFGNINFLFVTPVAIK